MRRIDSPSGTPVSFSAGIKDVLPVRSSILRILSTRRHRRRHLDARPVDLGLFQVSVDAGITEITISDRPKGGSFMIEFTANGTAYEQTRPWTWLTGTPVLSTTAGKRDLAVVWTIDGAAYFASMIAQYY